MNYEQPEHQPAKETTPVEGPHLPQVATQLITLEDKIKQILSNCNDIKHKKVIEKIVKGYKAGYTIVLHDINTKKPNWMGMTPATYKVDLETLIKEYLKKPNNYGYGVITGEQQGGFYVVAVDVDVDNEDCKEKISKEIESRLLRFGIHFYKETTKSKRLHYYILFDNITKEIENITELPFSYPCFKWKGGSKLPGKIEVFCKRNRYIIVYDGIINDNNPFFAIDKIFSDPTAFIDYANNWFETFTPIELDSVNDSIKEAVKEPIKEPIKQPEIKNKSLLFQKIVEAYKIIRAHHIVNGWEIEKVFSAYCIRENIAFEKVIEGFRAIYASEYDEKRTIRLLENTKKKDLTLLPTLYRVYNHISKALNSNIELSVHEKDILEDVLADLELNGYSSYKLPSYLKNAENVYLYESTEYESKDHTPYYEESYFIERNNGNIKDVVFVSIITFERKGIYKPHKLLHKKHVGIKADIVRGIKEGKFEDYEYLLNDQIVYRPNFNYSKIEDLIHEIQLISMKYRKFFDVSLYKKYLDIKTAIYLEENNNPPSCVIGKSTGWSDDFRFFYHYALNDDYHELHPEHVLYKKQKDLVIEKDKQHEIVKNILEEGKLLAVLLTVSVSSLFIRPFRLPGLTFVISGTTGVGKTTASLVATSLFYYSDDHLLDAQMTKVGLELMIAHLNSLPVLIDEAALAFNYSLQDLVFMVHSGRGKTRGTKNLTVDFKDLKSNVFWTTETTDIDELRRSGAFRRIMYIAVDSWDEITSLFQANDRINEQFAGCGVDYIKYLIEHMEEIKKAFKEETQRLHTEYKDILTIALNIWAGLILLEAYYNTKFIALRKTINKLLNDTQNRFVESRDNIVLQVMNYLESITYQRFHIIDKLNKDEEEIKVSRYESYGEYNKIEGIYYLNALGLKEIADKLGKNKHLLIKELEKANVLIAKNVTYYTRATKQRIKVYKLKFSEMKEDNTQDKNLDVPF
jgi:hypothetical protein